MKERYTKCKGCGIKFAGYYGDTFALHLRCSRPCIQEYSKDTMLAGKHRIIRGTLHILERTGGTSSKWQLRAISPEGVDIQIAKSTTKSPIEKLLNMMENGSQVKMTSENGNLKNAAGFPKSLVLT